MITIAAMRAAGIAETKAREFAEHIARACERYRIENKQRIAGFLAQCSHESAGFTKLTEDLFYKSPERIKVVWHKRFASVADAAAYTRNPTKLANRVYANRLGNGDEASGDGAKYAGKGLIQLTGRANYMAAGDAIGYDYKARPEAVALPEHAALTAAWFWATAGCNEMMDRGLIDEVTKRVNGPAMLGAEDRREKYHAALAELA